MSKIKQKTEKDENFPVLFLVGEKMRPLVACYYRAARFADDIADNPKLLEEEKLNTLNELEKAFYNPKEQSSFRDAKSLGMLFAAENLDSSMYTDLLKAFRKDACNFQPRIWEELIDYCNYSAAPVGRFILALYDENPSTYLPAATLCAVLQIVNHLQDAKQDALLMNRFYLPLDMCQKFDVRNSDLYLPYETKGLRLLVMEITEKLKGMLKDTAPLPRMVRSFRLKYQLEIIFSLTNRMIKKIEKEDILAAHIHLTKADWFLATGGGFVRTLLKIIGLLRY